MSGGSGASNGGIGGGEWIVHDEQIGYGAVIDQVREMDFSFEWNPDRAASNLRKHGVSFEEAQTVFADPFGRSIPDASHSAGKIGGSHKEYRTKGGSSWSYMRIAAM